MTNMIIFRSTLVPIIWVSGEMGCSEQWHLFPDLFPEELFGPVGD
jgi:hypothetical protein